MENENKIIGSLFNSINYRKPEELNMFIDNMNSEQALYCLIESVKYGFNRGIFNLEESETLSKSIRILTNSSAENIE